MSMSHARMTVLLGGRPFELKQLDEKAAADIDRMVGRVDVRYELRIYHELKHAWFVLSIADHDCGMPDAEFIERMITPALSMLDAEVYPLRQAAYIKAMHEYAKELASRPAA